MWTCQWFNGQSFVHIFVHISQTLFFLAYLPTLKEWTSTIHVNRYSIPVQNMSKISIWVWVFTQEQKTTGSRPVSDRHHGIQAHKSVSNRRHGTWRSNAPGCKLQVGGAGRFRRFFFGDKSLEASNGWDKLDVIILTFAKKQLWCLGKRFLFVLTCIQFITGWMNLSFVNSLILPVISTGGGVQPHFIFNLGCFNHFEFQSYLPRCSMYGIFTNIWSKCMG